MKHLEAHPYIVNLYGVAFQGLNPILIVELAIGNLPDHLYDCKKEGKRVDWLTKSRFCCEIADGLRALHLVDVVHGDIKGENILLFTDPDDENILIAKVAYFGYSRTRASIQAGRDTGFTPVFLAPECTE